MVQCRDKAHTFCFPDDLYPIISFGQFVKDGNGFCGCTVIGDDYFKFGIVLIYHTFNGLGNDVSRFIESSHYNSYQGLIAISLRHIYTIYSSYNGLA